MISLLLPLLLLLLLLLLLFWLQDLWLICPSQIFIWRTCWLLL
jgi:hypothetical protein